MAILKWIAVIAIAFSVGYFSRSPEPVVAPQVIADCLRLDAFKDVQSGLQQDQERVKRLEKIDSPSSSQTSSEEKQKKIIAQDMPGRATQERNDRAGAIPAAGEKPASITGTNFSDEEIDRLVAAPFNEELKKVRGPLREKYKEFAETTQQDDWDINTQNRITDALMGNVYSKFIELGSVACRVNYCEVRGRESKPQVINLMVSEMMLQDWWEMGHVQWTSGNADGAFYALLMKRPAM